MWLLLHPAIGIAHPYIAVRVPLNRKGVTQYLVWWSGLEAKDATWEKVRDCSIERAEERMN